VRTRTLTYFRLPTVPAVLLATFPLGVERRVCCGGERGSVWSVGLNVCSLAFPSCRLLVRTFRCSISGVVLGLEGVHNVPNLQYVWRRVIHASAFADEHDGSLNKLSLSIG
jgi:hypothetical protein